MHHHIHARIHAEPAAPPSPLACSITGSPTACAARTNSRMVSSLGTGRLRSLAEPALDRWSSRRSRHPPSSSPPRRRACAAWDRCRRHRLARLDQHIRYLVAPGWQHIHRMPAAQQYVTERSTRFFFFFFFFFFKKKKKKKKSCSRRSAQRWSNDCSARRCRRLGRSARFCGLSTRLPLFVPSS